MACPRTLLCFFTVVTSASGLMDRLGETREYMSPLPQTGEESYRSNPRLHMVKRLKREVMDAHRQPCAELNAPWRESTAQPAEGATLLRLRVRSFAQGGPRSAVFPGKSLFNFVRRAYRCCQEGFLCRNVKGIQGHLREGAHAEFLLSPDVLSMPIVRAELHLQIFHQQHLSIHPALLFLAKRNLPTRYEVWPRGDMVELKVDLLPLFQGLADTAAAGGGRGGASSLMNMLRWGVRSRGGPPQAPGQQSLQDTDEDDVWGEGLSRRPPPPPLELGLALSCSHEGQAVPCEHAGLRLSHMPFIALSY
ncbi:uncharacterized protein si:ch211-170d8.2 [Gadus morhua]|uniref:Uncharacterized protein n=1 Tax=Gadus morhua TaxID=8049 RepID=A0A8C5B4Q6_GADMO|nr:uncharacterized protein LOC115545158 [Gadus morhua]XP_056449261.1 uncharacterized protein si:ch211-170d8.2 [Gadus chalcogrammus]